MNSVVSLKASSSSSSIIIIGISIIISTNTTNTTTTTSTSTITTSINCSSTSSNTISQMTLSSSLRHCHPSSRAQEYLVTNFKTEEDILQRIERLYTFFDVDRSGAVEYLEMSEGSLISITICYYILLHITIYYYILLLLLRFQLLPSLLQQQWCRRVS